MNSDEQKTEVTPAEETTETTDQTVIVETTADPLDAITDPEELRKAAKAQRAIANRYKKSPPKPVTQINNNSNNQVQVKPTDILKSEEFELYRDGYSNDEIAVIMQNGGRKILSDNKSPITLGLKVSREQRRAEEAASRATDSSGTSEVERKYSKADLEKMSPADLEKVIGVVGQ